MADTLLSQKHAAEAAEIYQFAQSRSQLDAHGLDNLALALLDNEKLDQAEKVCQQALRQDLHNAEAHAILGDIYIRGSPTLAAQQFMAALEIDPTNARALRGLRALKVTPN